MQVKKIMTKNPACCTPDATLQEVAHMMEMYDCGCIPVVENHQTKRPVGTITDRDITIRAVSQNKNPLETKASDVMTSDVATVSPETSVEDCMNKMEDEEIRRILVVDKSGKCVGIVAQADLLEHNPHIEQTAHFIREVSESDEPRRRETESARSQFQERREERRTPRRNDYSFEQNEERETRHFSGKPQRKLRRKKESFFNSTTLLTLLGSAALGAGLRYYIGPEKESKNVSSENYETKTVAKIHLSDTKSTGATESFNTAGTSSVSTATGFTANTDAITGSVDSFNKTNDDNDLDPIVEVGRTASNKNT